MDQTLTLPALHCDRSTKPTFSTEKKTKKKRVDMVVTVHYWHSLPFVTIESAPHLKV
jgi:hypothetical protein